MHPYAQTILQLYDQLRRDGYSKEDLAYIRNVYELAMSLFSGRFQPSGKTFISHCVGTASILASLNLPAQVMAAGLIHNVYMNGDFGDGSRGVSNAKREKVRSVAGKEAEEYVARFATMRWNSRTLPDIRDRLDELNPTDRNVALIELADNLEHLLDLDVLYFAAGSHRYMDDIHILVEIAEKLGFPTLAAELKRAHSETISAQVLTELVARHKVSFVITPKSYRKRLSAVFYQEVDQASNYFRRQLIPKLRRLRRQFARRLKF